MLTNINIYIRIPIPIPFLFHENQFLIPYLFYSIPIPFHTIQYDAILGLTIQTYHLRMEPRDNDRRDRELAHECRLGYDEATETLTWWNEKQYKMSHCLESIPYRRLPSSGHDLTAGTQKSNGIEQKKAQITLLSIRIQI